VAHFLGNEWCISSQQIRRCCHISSATNDTLFQWRVARFRSQEERRNSVRRKKEQRAAGRRRKRCVAKGRNNMRQKEGVRQKKERMFS
jgi:hypothetical protein